jgi:hypothetical protein
MTDIPLLLIEGAVHGALPDGDTACGLPAPGYPLPVEGSPLRINCPHCLLLLSGNPVLFRRDVLVTVTLFAVLLAVVGWWTYTLWRL